MNFTHTYCSGYNRKFWQKSFYGNTVSLWLTSLLCIVASVILGKSIYWIFSRLVKTLTAKTKNTLDDLVVDLVEEPVVTAFIASGIYFSLNLLSLPGLAERTISKSYTLVITLIAAWLIVRFSKHFTRTSWFLGQKKQKVI